MADEPDNAILRLLREIRSTQQSDSSRLEKVERRLDEVHETLYAAAGMAAHANVRHDSVAEEIADLKKRIEKLEEKA